MKLIDLTHPFGIEMPVFPGDTPPQWKQVAFIEREGYNVSQLRTGMHVGTHMDAPLHMVPGGLPLSAFPPEHFVGKACMINAKGKVRVEEEDLDGLDLSDISIVLVYTAWYHFFGEEKYYLDYPELSLGVADRLVEAGIHVVCLDFPSPDRAPYAVHRRLLGNHVLIAENLTGLEALLPYKNFEVFALPARYDADGAPVRVVARVEEK